MIRPAVKRAHVPRVLPGRRIRLGMEQYGVASEIVDGEDGAIERLLVLLDGTRTPHGVWLELRATHPDWELEDVRDAIDRLTESGHVEDAGAPLPPGLCEDEVARQRSLREYFSWIDAEPRPSPHHAQARIKDASVVLLGLGGTGSAVAASLVASGIGALHCVDSDVVEAGNLTRQLLYTEADVGRAKVEAAIERLTLLNSRVSVTGEERRVGSANDVARLLRGHDVLVLCADEPADVIQHWTNEAALRTSTPWFVAAYTGAMTGVGAFVPGETGCWECAIRNTGTRDDAGERWLFDHRPHAVVAASAAICGHLCALDVLYHLAGLPSQARGRIYQLNLARWDHQYVVDATRDPVCPACGEAA